MDIEFTSPWSVDDLDCHNAAGRCMNIAIAKSSGIDGKESVDMSHSIDDAILRVTHIDTLYNNYKQTNASGFFYMRDRYLFLVTCRHVVINEATGHRPDQVSILLHCDLDDLKNNASVTLNLYHKDGKPAWTEHPSYGARADLAVLPVFDPTLSARYQMSSFRPEHLLGPKQGLSMGQRLLVLGFPLGFYDTVHNLPVARSATLASHYPTYFKGEPYFLTDARLHRGSSGAPVIAKFTQPGDEHYSWFLLGVHSAALDVVNRDPSQDQPLGLNISWYARLVDEMVSFSLRKLRQPEVHITREARRMLEQPRFKPMYQR